jgi:tetratricopeptide (TPR) repeat protein
MIIHEDGKATVIFSNNSTAWGSFFYEPSEDALRVDVQTNETPFTEQLTFNFINVGPTTATAVLNWEKKQIPFKIGVDVANVVLADMRQKLQSQSGFQRQNWEQAANFALINGGDLNEAMGWIDNAIAGQFYSQKTANNLSIKARIMNKMGKTQEYTALMDEASTMASANQLNNLGYQMLGTKDYDRALTYFKKAAELDPTNPNVYDSLGECYKTMGDKKNAIKYLKKSLSMNPPPAVKANSEKLLAELDKM